eukprot:TRINITY_DN46065_c0_g1_i1.p1 TRINITY_DN46065_c0_g1~~TRINITY_DN46065_c0_g1_i1.p1  ORF type:complete len:239 (-),score=56.68 TRINITY_DN46065_c0_g1_i1:139-855(-)
MLGRFFGKKKKEEPAPPPEPSAENAVSNAERELEVMESRIRLHQAQTDKMAEEAIALAKVGKKTEAMDKMRAKKVAESRLEKERAQRENLSRLVEGLRDSENQVELAGIMKALSARIEANLKQIGDLDAVIDKVEDVLQQHQEVNDVLGRKIATGVVDYIDDAELERELMESVARSEEVPDPTKAPTGAAAAGARKPTQEEEDAQLEAELARLTAGTGPLEAPSPAEDDKALEAELGL